MGAGSSDAGRRGDGVAISFAVLGPLQIVGGEGPIAISGLKERRLLLALLLEPSAVVPTDRLVDALWGDAPPPTAERTLQAYVARLRRALERRGDHGAVGRLLVGHGHGYAVVVEDSQLDALRFERLARQGRQSLEAGEVEPARARLGEALGLWRGLPYVELGDHHGAVVERQRLEAVRLTVVEDRLAADLAAGREVEVIPELERAVVEQPFRERLWGQLMVALYRAGRQADALRAFRRARDVLVEELGIEPGPELRHLEAAILAHDAELLVPVTSADEAGDRRVVTPGSARALPAALESAGTVFVGREAEITRLRDLWGMAFAGEGQFISIVGSEGIGKTRLAAELAGGVHREGSLVTYARCDHADRDPRRLFTQLVGSLDVDVGGDSTSELGEVVARRLGAWSQRQPVLVVVDDLHAATPETLDALADVATWCSGLAILVLALFRADVDPLAVPAGPASVLLTGLDRSATQSICTLYGTAWDIAELDAIHAHTQGVPLRVHEEASDRARRRMQEGLDDAAGLLAATRRTVARAESRVAEGVEGLQRLLERRRAQLRPGTTRSVTSPYKGLARFEAADAAVFFGRERLVAELAARATGASLIAVVGPSGSGKSSVVRAGLLPALDAGLVPGRPQAGSVTLVPGARPAAALARAWPAGDERGALFIDQFEECFTTCSDEAERQAFLDRVVSLAGTPGMLVIIAIRADQFAVAATHAELAVLMGRATVLVGPLRDDELARVIELPARHAGAELEPGLLDLVMRDARGRRGVLPLLSTSLLEARVRREAGLMTTAGYQAGGGVRGAVATLAEGVFARLDPPQQEAAKRIFLRLAAPTETGPADLGRRLPAADLGPSDDHAARHALAELIAGRLLVADGGTVELAHEALLWEWPRLRHWLDDDVEGQRLHAHLGAAARDWSEHGRDAGALYRGVRLNAATEWADRHADRLNDLERAFLSASVASAHRERDADRERLMTARRTNRRLRLLLCAVAVMLAAAVTAGALAVVANRRADEQADEAVEQREAADLGRLVALSRDQRSSARDVAMLLAVEANRRADTPATRGAIQAALIAEPRVGGYLHDSPGVNKLAYNPSGTVIAIGGTRAAVQLWDARTRRRIGPIVPTDVPTAALWFTSDDELVVAGEDGVVRTVRDGVLDDEPVVDAGEKLLHAAPGPDRTTLVTLAADGGATFWDLTSGRPTGPRFPTDAGTFGEVAVNVDGTIVATAVSTGGGGDIVLWDRASGTMLDAPLAARRRHPRHPDGRVQPRRAAARNLQRAEHRDDLGRHQPDTAVPARRWGPPRPHPQRRLQP